MIKTWVAFVIYSTIMVACYAWATFFPQAPFLALSSQFTIGFGLYVTKRLIQKKKTFGGEE